MGGTYTDRDWLYRKMIDEGKTQKEVAEIAQVSQRTISRYKNEFNIEKPWKDGDQLRTLYVEKGMSTREIAEEWHTGKTTILRWLRNHNIETRDPDGH